MMQQQLLFPGFGADDVRINPKPINVASVPQRSPFRYPGGKTWFVPSFRNWLHNKAVRPGMLVEPFAGGGIISLTALFEQMVEKVVMVELDEDIAAVWTAIAQGSAEWLGKRILDFELSKESVTRELATTQTDVREKAFQTILKNRTFHGGILAHGSGFLKNGENGKGIASRWYPQTLAKRLKSIATVASNIDFRQDDGLKVIQEFSGQKDAIFFIDPPYTAGGKKAGRRLYRYFELDHDRLFSLCKRIKGDFLMTYDDAEEVKQMARKYGFQIRLIPMKNTHHKTMEELVISKDLTWMDQYQEIREPVEQYGKAMGS